MYERRITSSYFGGTSRGLLQLIVPAFIYKGWRIFAVKAVGEDLNRAYPECIQQCYRLKLYVTTWAGNRSSAYRQFVQGFTMTEKKSDRQRTVILSCVLQPTDNNGRDTSNSAGRCLSVTCGVNTLAEIYLRRLCRSGDGLLPAGDVKYTVNRLKANLLAKWKVVVMVRQHTYKFTLVTRHKLQ
jgi:hypothetical protein